MKDIALPKHIGFIMDGNGRWATKRGLPRNAGHKQGVKALKKVLYACDDFSIEVVTVFAFSTENWSRPKEEVDAILGIVANFNDNIEDVVTKRNIQVKFIGDISVFDKNIKDSIDKILSVTANNTGAILCIALNYGGLDDIVQAANKAAMSGGEITKESITANLYTAGLPDVDLVVRSGGEKRLSNFLLYQAAYSELIFSDTLWPDFNKAEVKKVLDEYKNRTRKFGGV